MIRVEWPMELPSTSNGNKGGHWAVRARRTKAQRAATTLMLKSRRLASELASVETGILVGDTSKRLALVVTLTRVAPRKLDDDNLRGAFKAVRDAVAAHLGIDDGSDAVRWEYAQAKGSLAMVRIEFSVLDAVKPTEAERWLSIRS